MIEALGLGEYKEKSLATFHLEIPLKKKKILHRPDLDFEGRSGNRFRPELAWWEGRESQKKEKSSLT